MYTLVYLTDTVARARTEGDEGADVPLGVIVRLLVQREPLRYELLGLWELLLVPAHGVKRQHDATSGGQRARRCTEHMLQHKQTSLG